MPMIRVELHKGRTTEQKTACAKEIVRAVQQHLNAPPEATQVVFVDVDPADWMLGQKLAAK